MMSKMKCFGMLAGCTLATGALYAEPYNQTFNGSTDLPSGWTGGTVVASNVTYASTAGLPISASLASDNNVLLIEGNTTYSSSTLGADGAPLVDMMVQTARPDDELGFPSSEDTSTIQIAVAVDSDGCFNAYCKNKSGTVGWYKLSDTPTEAAGWARVSFLFDYTVTPKRCQIRINGEPVMSANGYLTASTTDGTSQGAWYNLATDGNGVGSMKVIGCTAIDEVVMAGTSTSYAIASGAAVDGVPCEWYDRYGIAWDAAGSYDGSGMTALNKYLSCLSPLDSQTFALKTMSVDAANNKMTVGIPETVATAGRQVLLQYSEDPTFKTITGSSVVAAGATTADVPLPASGTVYYCRLLATDAQ